MNPQSTLRKGLTAEEEAILNRQTLKNPNHSTATRSRSASEGGSPQTPTDCNAQINQVRQQSQGAIATASQGIIGSAGQSIQKLDDQLSGFEDRYVAAVQQRIAEVPARIEAKLAAALTWGQEGIDPLSAVFGELESWAVADVSSIEQFLFSGDVPIAQLLPEAQVSQQIK